MSDFEQKYIVQDLETGEFLYPEPSGSVGFTIYINQAGHFDSYEDAFEAGEDEIGGAFSVFGFFVLKTSKSN